MIPPFLGAPRRTPWRAPWTGPALLAAILSGCGSSGPPIEPPRLVVLFTACSLSKDSLAPYRTDVTYTPSLARFAADSVVFTAHCAEEDQSTPAFGIGDEREPARLGGVHPIAEAFRERGYEVFAWNGHGSGVRLDRDLAQEDPLVPHFLPAPGPATAARAPDGDAVLRVQSPASSRFERLLEDLHDDPERRAFVLATASSTLGPYHRLPSAAAIAGFLQRHPEQDPGLSPGAIERGLELYEENRFDLQWSYPRARERLDAGDPGDVELLRQVLDVAHRTSVSELDAVFGELVEQIRDHGLIDESLIVLTAEHGALVGRSLSPWTHGAQLSADVVEVPLIVRSTAPGVEPGRYAHVTRSIDLLPTMVGLCGLARWQKSPEAADLSRALMGREAPPELLAFFHTTVVGSPATPVDAWSMQHEFHPRTEPGLMRTAVRKGDLVFEMDSEDGRAPHVSVFDVVQDPEETRDLWNPDDPLHAEMVGRLEAYRSRLIDRFRKSRS